MTDFNREKNFLIQRQSLIVENRFLNDCKKQTKKTNVTVTLLRLLLPRIT